jgi:hypothetical protein
VKVGDHVVPVSRTVFLHFPACHTDNLPT